ncbi:MAG: tetratricopeptide repeat protein, partial [Flavobacteriales bacterium]|nr:tetratricopeptide repeat protein [Flavobacteriales bacterium]
GIASVAIGVFLYQGKGESPVEVAETTQVEQLSEHEAVQVEQMKLADATRPEAEQKPARQTAERKMQPAADTARVVQPGTQSIPKQQASITVKKEGELFIWPEVVKEDGVVLKHINNYKVVDYGAMRHDKWVPFDADLPGTSADRENPETPPHTAEPEIKVPYLRYIQDCIEAFYKGETNRCLQHFATVLQQYPDDVNAQFYSAMCFYKKGDYAKAIKFYDQSLANDTRTFGEESLYYKAMSLKNSGKTKEANDLFTYIVNGNGYYRKQAEAELKAQN